MFRPPVGSGRGDEDESGRRRHSSRVKFLPLAWAGMPKTSFRKNSDSPHPLYKNFKRSLFYYSLHSDDVKDVIKLKPILFQGMKKKEIAAFLMSCAREAYAGHFPDKEKAENLAIYRAGLWYSLITGHTKQLTIEVALGIMGRLYPLVKMQAEFEILDGNPSLLRNAYDDFLKAIEQQTKI